CRRSSAATAAVRLPHSTSFALPLQLAEPDPQLFAALRRSRLANEDDVRGDPERLDGERRAGKEEKPVGPVVKVEQELPAADVGAGEAVCGPDGDVEDRAEVHEGDDPADDEDEEDGQLNAHVPR